MNCRPRNDLHQGCMDKSHIAFYSMVSFLTTVVHRVFPPCVIGQEE